MINITTFTITLILETAFLIRFRFKADNAALTILFSYLIVNGFRIFTPKDLYSSWDTWITPTATTAIFSVLFFFVFEMSYMKALLKSESPSIYKVQERNIKIQKYFCIGSMIFIYCPASMRVFGEWN